MYYEILVVRYGYHVFATAPRSAQNARRAKELYEDFKNRFPEEEGYNISITRWDKTGYEINPDELKW